MELRNAQFSSDGGGNKEGMVFASNVLPLPGGANE